MLPKFETLQITKENRLLKALAAVYLLQIYLQRKSIGLMDHTGQLYITG